MAAVPQICRAGDWPERWTIRRMSITLNLRFRGRGCRETRLSRRGQATSSDRPSGFRPSVRMWTALEPAHERSRVPCRLDPTDLRTVTASGWYCEFARHGSGHRHREACPVDDPNDNLMAATVSTFVDSERRLTLNSRHRPSDGSLRLGAVVRSRRPQRQRSFRLSFVGRRRDGPLHLRHRSFDRCGQRVSSE